MVDTYVQLGGFTFDSSFATPEEINGGGEQRLITHKLIGGQRVIDTMGYDPDPIEFAGRFRGSSGIYVAKLLETFVQQGTPVVFSYFISRYLVVVKSVKWYFEKYYEVRYHVVLEVQADQTAVIYTGPQQSLNSLVNSDLSLVQTIFGDSSSTVSFVNSAINAVVTPINAIIAQVNIIGSLVNATAAQVNSVLSLVQTATAASAAQVAAQDALIFTQLAGGVVSGGSPTAMAISLANQAAYYQNQADLVYANAVLGRLQYNIEALQ